MEININNYTDLDEQEMRQEDERQIKEIQTLLINELDGIEFDDEDDDEEDDEDLEHGDIEDDYDQSIEDMTTCKTIQDYSTTHKIESLSNNKENQFLHPFNVINNIVPNWTASPFNQFYSAISSNNQTNPQYKYPQTNNNCNGTADSSINWEISLHGEMGIPVSSSCSPVFPRHTEYLTSTKKSQLVPSDEKSSCMKIITRDVAVECVPASQRELDNLELLYSARGKRIEQLQSELEAEREKRIKETRISNHKITLLESEQKNESRLLKNAYEEIELQRKVLVENKDLINDQNNHILKLESDTGSLKENLESCNIVIGGLNEQLMALTSSTVISRNNQKQADLLDCINRQFDTESYRLKMEIQRMTQRTEEKMREIEKLETLIDEQAENHRKQKFEWQTEHDRLLDELENEKELFKELEKSINQGKIDQLNNQICDLKLGKSLVEDMNDYLQEQVMELSQQLLIYEQSLNLLDKNDATNRSSYYENINVKENYKFSFSGSCPLLNGGKMFSNTKDENNLMAETNFDLKKQIFVLVARTTSLTNRLLEIRKANLDSKGCTKRLQKEFEEQKYSKDMLQAKFQEIEGRLKELQSGEETNMEKQLKLSVESIEIMKDSLEQQCKALQTQLKQATDSMKESERSYKQLDHEFLMYKQLAEEDKISSIEDVKRVCNCHYENLREQLEQSWMAEKELLMDEEKTHRDKLVRDLSDAIKEVDRVKNLYIQLSQQKSNEESDRSNWNDWLTKKLKDQKHSLNQQFKKDKEAIINEIEARYQSEIERLQSEMVCESVIREDKCEGTVAPVLIDKICFNHPLGSQEKSVQVDDTEMCSNGIDKMKLINAQLQSSLDCCQQECKRLQKECDMLYKAKLTIEKENTCLASQIQNPIPLSPMSEECSQSTLSSEIQVPHCLDRVPNIIRSTTPQLVFTTKRRDRVPSKVPNFTYNMHSQFQTLKEDLITQLTEISHSAKLNSRQNSLSNQCQHDLFSSVDSLTDDVTMKPMKEQLYNFILEVQVKASSTLQHELEKSRILVRQSLLDQLKQIIPVLLSVDGQLMDISPPKIKTLVDKVILMLDHLPTGSPVSDLNHQPTNFNLGSSHPFSLTSTPKKYQSLFKKPTDTSEPINASTDSWNSITKSNISLNSYPPHRNVIESQCKKLKDEIAQLSEALNTPDIHNVRSPITSFHNVDINWLCSESQSTSDKTFGTNL